MKKGFTIIEILATITLMLLIISIIVPGVMSFSKDIKEKEYKSIVESILISAKEYGEDNINSFVGSNCLQYNGSVLKVSNLLEEGYLKGNNNKSEIIDPRNNEIIDNDICVKYIRIEEIGHHEVIACLCTTGSCDCNS